MKSLTYSRKDIENMIIGLRGKPYGSRQMKYFYAAIRDKIGQQEFSPEATVKILFRVVASQLFPQRKLDTIAETLTTNEIEKFIEYTSQLLGNIESVKTIKVPETSIFDLDFLADAFVGLGLKRYKPGTLKTKIREYLRSENQQVTQTYDYNHISGAVVNGVLLREYGKVHNLKLGLTVFSSDLVERSHFLKQAIELLEQYKHTIKLTPLGCELLPDEKLKRAVTRIKNNLSVLSQDENKAKLTCIRFLTAYGKPGFRQLSLITHPDVCKSKFAGEFQRILNSCYKLVSNGTAKEEMAKLKNKKEKRHKRAFHKSPKWQEYVERRRAKGWHSQYYGDAI